MAPGIAHDLSQCQDSVDAMKEFDADERIFVIIAHDNSLRDLIGLWPERGTVNRWAEEGWGEKSRWRFLRDFGEAVGIERLASGQW